MTLGGRRDRSRWSRRRSVDRPGTGRRRATTATRGVGSGRGMGANQRTVPDVPVRGRATRLSRWRSPGRTCTRCAAHGWGSPPRSRHTRSCPASSVRGSHASRPRRAWMPPDSDRPDGVRDRPVGGDASGGPGDPALGRQTGRPRRYPDDGRRIRAPAVGGDPPVAHAALLRDRPVGGPDRRGDEHRGGRRGASVRTSGDVGDPRHLERGAVRRRRARVGGDRRRHADRDPPDLAALVVLVSAAFLRWLPHRRMLRGASIRGSPTTPSAPQRARAGSSSCAWSRPDPSWWRMRGRMERRLPPRVGGAEPSAAGLGVVAFSAGMAASRFVGDGSWDASANPPSLGSAHRGLRGARRHADRPSSGPVRCRARDRRPRPRSGGAPRVPDGRPDLRRGTRVPCRSW